MSSYDIISDMNLTRGANQTLSGTTQNNSALIDMKGWSALTVYLYTHTVTDAGTAAGFTMKLQHSDSTAAASFVDVTAADLVPNSAGGTTVSVLNDTDDNILAGGVGYVGNRRYVRAAITGTTATDAVVNVEFVRARPATRPVATTGSTTAAT